MALQAGTRLGPYEVLSLIGAGGMGEVYQARDTGLDRKVAVKVLACLCRRHQQLVMMKCVQRRYVPAVTVPGRLRVARHDAVIGRLGRSAFPRSRVPAAHPACRIPYGAGVGIAVGGVSLL